jgi:hypothetical protein
LRARHGRLVPGDARGAEVHAAASLRERRILLEPSLRRHKRECARILTHELFHFVWARLGNPARRDWAALLAAEIRVPARGEMGWSAESRKRTLRPDDAARRSRRWREYCCESFCDTAAWLYGGLGQHAEVTLAQRFRAGRRQWFQALLASRPEGFRV